MFYLYRNLLEDIRAAGVNHRIILLVITDKDDNARGIYTAASVKAALAKKPNIVLWYLSSTPNAEAVGEAIGIHYVLPYVHDNLGVALRAAYLSIQQYFQTGRVEPYTERVKKAAMGRV